MPGSHCYCQQVTNVTSVAGDKAAAPGFKAMGPAVQEQPMAPMATQAANTWLLSPA